MLVTTEPTLRMCSAEVVGEGEHETNSINEAFNYEHISNDLNGSNGFSKNLKQDSNYKQSPHSFAIDR